jgi:prenyltransferase beta subunit
MSALGDGGLRQGDADLWCSYAAVRTLRWLDRKPDAPADVAAFVGSRRNTDGGYAWQRGLPSDSWATYYCTQTLLDLGTRPERPELVADWVAGVRDGTGGFAMTPGQSPDVWATYYATRTIAEAVRGTVGDQAGLAGWLAALQCADGGLTWQPGGSVADVRACYYGAHAWLATTDRPFPWRVADLVAWLRAQQGPDGGFRFAPGGQACLWATFRAVRALDALGAAPAATAAAVDWIERRRLPDGGYERWPGYGRSDVWACFCAVGALRTLRHDLPAVVEDGVADFVGSCALPGSGFTYRRPDDAGDSLATAAGLISSALDGAARPGLARWLHAAHLPFEDGVMYMPGRGAEVRCTLWAVEALRLAGERLDEARLRHWVSELQNPDGGFGYWLGRGSDLVSTASAVELADRLTGGDPAAVLDARRAIAFVASCRAGGHVRANPAGEVTATATAQAARVLWLLGEHDTARTLHEGLGDFARAIGGYGATPRALPDLATTYQVALTGQCLGTTGGTDAAGGLLARIDLGGRYAWTPLSRQPAGPLADCLGALLARWVADPAMPLPRLNL